MVIIPQYRKKSSKTKRENPLKKRGKRKKRKKREKTQKTQQNKSTAKKTKLTNRIPHIHIYTLFFICLLLFFHLHSHFLSNTLFLSLIHIFPLLLKKWRRSRCLAWTSIRSNWWIGSRHWPLRKDSRQRPLTTTPG